MSHIEPGDEDLHHSDNSHRHTAGPGHGLAEDDFLERMREHMNAHRSGVGHESSAVAPRRVRWSH